MMRSPPAVPGQTENRLRRLFTVFLVIYAIAGTATLTPDHPWGDDWAQYVLHARNLALGLAYPETGYLFNPDFPTAGPATYPPAFPLLLAPIFALVGLDLAFLKLVGIACLVLALPFAQRLLAPAVGMQTAMLGVALVALHPVYWQHRQLVTSESPYILFSLLTLWWAQRPGGGEDSHRHSLVHGAMLGVLLCAAVSTRTVGIALAPALLVYGWARRKRWSWFVGLATSIVPLLAVQSMLLAPPPTYEAELRPPSAARIAAQPAGYLIELTELFPLPFGLSPAAGVLVVLATVAGTWFACATSPPAGEARGVRALAARVPVYVWYLGAYVAGLLLASVSPDSRLLIPLMPIAIPLAVHGVLSIALRYRSPRIVLAGLALAALAYVLALGASGRFAPSAYMATCRECLEMFAFVRQYAPRDGVVVFTKPRAMALLGERRSWAPPPRYTSEQFERRARRLGADLIVDGVPGSAYARRHPLPEVVTARLHAAGAKVVFRNKDFVVFRPGPAPQGP